MFGNDKKLMEQIEKINRFKNLVCEINISKYEQEEYIKIVNLIYMDLFRLQEKNYDTSSD